MEPQEFCNTDKQHNCLFIAGSSKEHGQIPLSCPEASLAQKVPDYTCCQSCSHLQDRLRKNLLSGSLPGDWKASQLQARRFSPQGCYPRCITEQRHASPHTNRVFHMAEIAPTEAQVLFSEFPVRKTFTSGLLAAYFPVITLFILSCDYFAYISWAVRLFPCLIAHNELSAVISQLTVGASWKTKQS